MESFHTSSFIWLSLQGYTEVGQLSGGDLLLLSWHWIQAKDPLKVSGDTLAVVLSTVFLLMATLKLGKS